MRLLYFVAFSFLIFACSKKIYVHSDTITSTEDLPKYSTFVTEGYDKSRKHCSDPLNYVMDTLHPEFSRTRYIRINFHIMNNEAGDQNFSEKVARSYFYELRKNANYRLGKNVKMNLPVGNNTPVLDPMYRYKLTASPSHPNSNAYYFHYDDDLYYFVNKGKNRNNYNKDVIKKYAVDADTILNIFVMPHHPDSVASKTYKNMGTGISLGSSIKIAGLYENKGKSWAYATLLNHEIGHTMGLNHAWTRSDGCDDTPVHPNCFHDTGRPPCDGPASNNMMDYNNSQMAITPCQIGRIHRNIARENSLQRKLVIPTWCTLDTTYDIIIKEKIEWLGARDMENNIIIEKGGSLKVCCRLSMPAGSGITVKPGGKLILYDSKVHNACGDLWNGITIETQGEEKGVVEYLGDTKVLDVLGKS